MSVKRTLRKLIGSSFTVLPPPAGTSNVFRLAALCKARRGGIQVALGVGSALLVMEALLLIPPAIFGVIGIQLVRSMFGVSVLLHIVNDLLVVTFSVFQYLAVEAATLIFLVTAVASQAN